MAGQKKIALKALLKRITKDLSVLEKAVRGTKRKSPKEDDDEDVELVLDDDEGGGDD